MVWLKWLCVACDLQRSRRVRLASTVREGLRGDRERVGGLGRGRSGQGDRCANTYEGALDWTVWPGRDPSGPYKCGFESLSVRELVCCE